MIISQLFLNLYPHKTTQHIVGNRVNHSKTRAQNVTTCRRSQRTATDGAATTSERVDGLTDSVQCAECSADLCLYVRHPLPTSWSPGWSILTARRCYASTATLTDALGDIRGVSTTLCATVLRSCRLCWHFGHFHELRTNSPRTTSLGVSIWSRKSVSGEPCDSYIVVCVADVYFRSLHCRF